MLLHIGAALHGKTRRFVEDDDVGIPVKHRIEQSFRLGGGKVRRFLGRRRGLGGGQGRHAYGLSRGKPLAGFRSRTVDPDLSGSQQLLQRAMAELGKPPLEPTVKTKVVFVVGYGKSLNEGHGLEH